MKRFLTLIVVFSFNFLTAQEEPQRVSLEVEDATLLEVVTQIQEKTHYQFYYVEEWLTGKTFSGVYNNAALSEVLEDLFDDTPINFYVLNENQIVLSKNNRIYDELPQAFYGPKEDVAKAPEEVAVEQYNPIFYNASENIRKERPTVHIGKETKISPRQRFTLSGTVTNEETGAPIPDLAVTIKDSDIGTVTDFNGSYSIRIPGGLNVLQTSSLGNEDIEMEVVMYNDGELNLILKEDYQLLGEVFLESNPDENVKDATAGAEEINVEEIKNIPLVLGERDVMKVAATLPGISSAGEGAAGFNVRGGKTDQNLILLDDAVIYNPGHFFGIFSAINPFTTGDVNIYKGYIPPEYGGRLSSVFDMRSKDANTDKFAGEVSLGPVTSNVALEIPIVKEKSGLLLGGRSTYSDWILKSLDEESLKNSRASFFDIVAKYNHKFSEKTELKTTGYFSRDVFSITSDSLYSYNNRLFSLRLNHQLNEKNRASLILTNSDYQFDIDYESQFNNNFTSGYQINETEAKLRMEHDYSPQHQLNYGISSKLYVIQPGELEPLGAESIVEPLSIPKEKGLESAIFIADDFEVNDKLLISGGIRYSLFAALGEKTQYVYEEGMPRRESTVVDTLHYGNNELVETYGGAEFRLSARYMLLPNLSAKLSYNNAFQYIHTLSNNTTVSPTDTYKLTDLNIKPQRGNLFSLGLYQNLDNNTYELSLEGYYKESQNILDYKVGAQLFLNENIDTEVLQGEGKSYGAELLLKKTKGKLNGWLGYTYSRSYIKLDSEFREERVNNGEFFPSNFDKPHDFSLVANYKITQRFSFSANFVYQTGRPVTYPTGKYIQGGSEYVLYSDRNEFRIPDYYRLDLSFNVEGNHKIKKFAHSFWNISVYNVLGRNNPYSVFFVTDQGEIKAYKSSIFSIPVPTITYNFKF